MEQLCVEALSIFRAAVQAVKPDILVRNIMRTTPSSQLQIQQKTYNLSQNVYIVGFGKAVLGMAAAVENILNGHLVSGIISVPKGIQKQIKDAIPGPCLKEDTKLRVFEGAHNNLPDSEAMAAAMQISDLVSSLKENDILLVLISGGGSALLPAPLPGIALEEKQRVIQLLSSKGATIQELNIVRKRLSTLKGGLLALKAKPAQVISLILSDIIGNPLDLIASAPTVKNTDDPTLPMTILNKYKLCNEIPEKVRTVLQNLQVDKPNETDFDHVCNVIIGSNSDAVNAASRTAKDLGYTTFIMTTQLQGIAEEVGFHLAELALAVVESNFEGFAEKVCNLSLVNEIKDDMIIDISEAIKHGNPVCLLFGGETVVHVKGKGLGGRNQELALAASLKLENTQHDIIILSGGTDGIDGPTDAAGAIATPQVIATAAREGVNAKEYLSNNDSFSFYKQIANRKWHIISGHTGTNVMDVIVMMLKSPRA